MCWVAGSLTCGCGRCARDEVRAKTSLSDRPQPYWRYRILDIHTYGAQTNTHLLSLSRTWLHYTGLEAVLSAPPFAQLSHSVSRHSNDASPRATTPPLRPVDRQADRHLRAQSRRERRAMAA